MTTITERLHNLYFSESKPKKLKPVDVALLTYLILRQAEDHFIFDSQETLGKRLGCERETVARSIDRLKRLGWIEVEQRWEFNAKTHRKTRTMYAPLGLSINLEKLPTTADRPTRIEPSEDAKDMAKQHTGILARNGMGSRYKRSPKRFERHQQHAAQRLIDEVGGYDAAVEVFNFALEHPAHRKAALTSLYHIRRRVKQIAADMEEAAATATESGQPVGAEG